MAIKSKTQLQTDISTSTFTAPQQVILDDMVDSYEDYFPQINTAARNALTPTLNQIIFNTDVNRNEYWNGSAWLGIGQNLATPMTVKVDFSSTAIKQSDTVPVVGIVAPGAGLAIAPLQVLTRFTAGSAGYAGTFTGIFMRCGTKTNSDYFAKIIKGGILNQTVNKSGLLPMLDSSILDAIVENDSIVFSADGTVTTGDGTLSVWITYSLIPY